MDGVKVANFDAMLTDARAATIGDSATASPSAVPPVVADIASESKTDDASGLAVLLTDLGAESHIKICRVESLAAPVSNGEAEPETPLGDAAPAPQEPASPDITQIQLDPSPVRSVPLPDPELVAPETTPAPGVDDRAAAGSDPALQGPKPADIALAVQFAAAPETKPTLPANEPDPAATATPEDMAVEPKAAAASADARASQPMHIPAPKSMPPDVVKPELAKETAQASVASPNAADTDGTTQAVLADKPAVTAQIAAQTGPLTTAPESVREAASQPLPQPVSTARPEWPETFVRSVQVMPMQEGETLTIALTPERLGGVQVRMEMVDGVATVNIVTETPEAAKLFVEHQQRLAETFARNGIEMGNQNVTTTADGGNARRDTGQGQQPHEFAEDAPHQGSEDNLNDSALADMVRRRGLVDLTA